MIEGAGEVLISPTEPSLLKDLGTVSSEPEKYGVDVLFTTADGRLVGIQRKETRDLVNSLRDGRFPILLGKMKQLDLGLVIVEGDWQWTNDGVSLRVNGFTQKKLTGLLFSIQSRGYWALQTPTLQATLESVLSLKSRLNNPEHLSSLMVRPKPNGTWGRLTDNDWSIYLLQSFEGIGLTQAGRILKHFGRVPIRWTVGLEELIAVEGIGAKRAAALWKALEEVEVEEIEEMEKIEETVILPSLKQQD